MSSAHGDVCTRTRQGDLEVLDPDSVPLSAVAAASLPLSLEGLGLRSTSRLRGAVTGPVGLKRP